MIDNEMDIPFDFTFPLGLFHAGTTVPKEGFSIGVGIDGQVDLRNGNYYYTWDDDTGEWEFKIEFGYDAEIEISLDESIDFDTTNVLRFELPCPDYPLAPVGVLRIDPFLEIEPTISGTLALTVASSDDSVYYHYQKNEDGIISKVNESQHNSFEPSFEIPQDPVSEKAELSIEIKAGVEVFVAIASAAGPYMEPYFSLGGSVDSHELILPDALPEWQFGMTHGLNFKMGAKIDLYLIGAIADLSYQFPIPEQNLIPSLTPPIDIQGISVPDGIELTVIELLKYVSNLNYV
jgi:hypothetical protein